MISYTSVALFRFLLSIPRLYHLKVGLIDHIRANEWSHGLNTKATLYELATYAVISQLDPKHLMHNWSFHPCLWVTKYNLSLHSIRPLSGVTVSMEVKAWTSLFQVWFCLFLYDIMCVEDQHLKMLIKWDNIFWYKQQVFVCFFQDSASKMCVGYVATDI